MTKPVDAWAVVDEAGEIITSTLSFDGEKGAISKLTKGKLKLWQHYQEIYLYKVIQVTITPKDQT